MNKHITFNSLKEFIGHLNIPKNRSYGLTNEETAYFEFHPYKGDDTVIRGWIEGIGNDKVFVSFKYREFRLGDDVWSFNEAEKYITKIEYYFSEE